MGKPKKKRIGVLPHQIQTTRQQLESCPPETRIRVALTSVSSLQALRIFRGTIMATRAVLLHAGSEAIIHQGEALWEEVVKRVAFRRALCACCGIPNGACRNRSLALVRALSDSAADDIDSATDSIRRRWGLPVVSCPEC